ncbi:hypothetical protein AGMMS49525_03980 [Bacteroidia bacterium]|nr:hypothetical protein AGMMS49525_03830 [Bacteroidia bacterium]GHT01887.1 hypothetical protein AGMMS49525_03980 [Bacteroidia bacterium]
MKLDIISPEAKIYSGPATLVTLPGAQGSFTILENHAPIISPLNKGVIVYEQKGESVTLPVDGGFVEAKNNVVTVCIE